ncbi:MAG: alkaline shock response membrane anchor protein AmaP [Bacteroides sp.]|nr:alkaline shock response membrane anchor protein AmaP [Bacteroides sp.]MCM1549513.1 alkaline shock response membrane anchor protein AmaP [Clostridium sp.]
MAYDWKKDWEETKQNMVRLNWERKINAACQGWNQEMTELVNAYKQEVAEWYRLPHFPENGFQTTTQNLWYTHYLNKKRLRALGLTAHYDYIQPTDYIRGENQHFPYWHYNHDGKNLICRISDAMHYKKSFFRGKDFIWSDEGSGLPGQYYIIQARGMGGNYICPNCGREDSLEHLIDGCDYCGTKFQLEDFKEKVSSVYIPGSRTQKRNGFTLLKNFWPFYIVLLLFFVGSIIVSGIFMAGLPVLMEQEKAMEIRNILEHMELLLVPAGMLIALLAIIIFLVVLLGKTTKESVRDGAARTRKTLTELRNVDTYFSEESFIANLSNKLLSICYAETMEEICCFAECDMLPFIQSCKNVIDCKMLECVLMDYRIQGEYQYLATKVKLRLAQYDNGRVNSSETHVMLGLVKSIHAVTQSIHDVNIYHCNSCGRSLTLLNGGRCEYCGNTLDLKKYDWIIGQCELIL